MKGLSTVCASEVSYQQVAHTLNIIVYVSINRWHPFVYDISASHICQAKVQ